MQSFTFRKYGSGPQAVDLKPNLRVLYPYLKIVICSQGLRSSPKYIIHILRFLIGRITLSRIRPVNSSGLPIFGLWNRIMHKILSYELSKQPNLVGLSCDQLIWLKKEANLADRFALSYLSPVSLWDKRRRTDSKKTRIKNVIVFRSRHRSSFPRLIMILMRNLD